MRSRIQAPVGLNSRLLLPLRRASATIFSARGRRSASKFLLQQLLRFASQAYTSVLGATEALKGLIDAPKQKALKKPARARR
ncbi:hypothetical protein JQ634_19665 [Bradyrhizobium sp. AUGA SZCCT0240]|uniref:hypothetical protein n=1 Tax=unclassified Bradyrhizobium TaxID=2631580 RepID=UPI001BACD4AA|nr:hypothetical protein [Bradyrhizobium sp. AUGA SZCCT0158]MBR1241029.1 hypothetical protein [Bradyrhizobium sp. AUGA SZCCT0274]MBR1255913.1 hypothetical protein [Bradyrhizobium sp. AUGA SZCCT0240]